MYGELTNDWTNPFESVYGVVTTNWVLFIISCAVVVYPNDGTLIVFPTTELVQALYEPLSVIVNKYDVGKLYSDNGWVSNGANGIPLTVPVFVLWATTFEYSGFINSVIDTWGLL